MSTRDALPFYVAGEARRGRRSFEVRNPYDGATILHVSTPGEKDLADAARAARDAFAVTRRLPLHVRAEALAQVSRALEERAEDVARTIALEGGKPLKWARVEAQRAVSTFRWAAEEARREGGELLRLDTEAALGTRLAVIRRFPLGPVLGITPFNFPVNLVAHKLAPALAVGAPAVIKPATKTPLGALLLAELVSETDLPPAMLSVLPVEGDVAGEYAKDPTWAKVSFTGSSAVGWALRANLPRKVVTLELGGNAGVIVHSDADVGLAAQRVAYGGYYQAGQSCIAVQRVLVHRDVEESFIEQLVAEVEGLVVGDPMDDETDVGPLIDPQALERVSDWVDEAVAGGARVLTGGRREDPFYAPTVLTDTTPSMKVRCEEVFGPVVSLVSYERFEDAIDQVNDSRYGLQAGVFTSDVGRVFHAFNELEVGGVIVNDVSSFRADQMPYGGTKDSGVGREGVAWAMREMTEPRVMVLTDVSL